MNDAPISNTIMAHDLNHCEVSQSGHVAIVAIDRPQVRNALHPPASRELDDVLDALMGKPEVRAIILTGKGSSFCAGNDLKHQAEGGTQALPSHGFGGMTARFDRTKPVIAAVNGPALGGGFEIALSCDLIIASEHAAFALPEARIGVVATAGGLLRLPRQIPFKRAMSLILTGGTLSAHEAYSLGLVNEVVPADQLLTAALDWAGRIAEASPAAVRAAMEVVRAGMAETAIDQAYSMQKSLPSVMELYASEDFVEGPRAFAQKRKPNWGA